MNNYQPQLVQAGFLNHQQYLTWHSWWSTSSSFFVFFPWTLRLPFPLSTAVFRPGSDRSIPGEGHRFMEIWRNHSIYPSKDGHIDGFPHHKCIPIPVIQERCATCITSRNGPFNTGESFPCFSLRWNRAGRQNSWGGILTQSPWRDWSVWRLRCLLGHWGMVWSGWKEQSLITQYESIWYNTTYSNMI